MLQKLQDGGTTAAHQVFSGRCDFAPNGEFKAYRSWSLKGLSHEIFRPVFWSVWTHLGLNVSRFWFLNCYDAPLVFGSCFKLWCVLFQTFLEISRDTLMLLKNILGEWRNLLSILGDSTNLREVLTPFAAFLGGSLTQKKGKLENCGLSWYEMH